MNNHEKKDKSYAKASFLLWGIGIGAIVGLLFAPRTGRDIRHAIRETTDKSRKELERRSQRFTEIAHNAIDKGKQYIERGRETFGGAVGANKHAYRDTREDMRNEHNDRPPN